MCKDQEETMPQQLKQKRISMLSYPGPARGIMRLLKGEFLCD